MGVLRLGSKTAARRFSIFPFLASRQRPAIIRRPSPYPSDPVDNIAPMSVPVISLFSGAGGLDLAAQRCAEKPAWLEHADHERVDGPLGIAVALDYEMQAIETLQMNHPGVPAIQAD